MESWVGGIICDFIDSVASVEVLHGDVGRAGEHEACRVACHSRVPSQFAIFPLGGMVVLLLDLHLGAGLDGWRPKIFGVAVPRGAGGAVATLCLHVRHGARQKQEGYYSADYK